MRNLRPSGIGPQRPLTEKDALALQSEMTYTRPGLIRMRQIAGLLLKELLRRRHGYLAIVLLLAGCVTAQKPVVTGPPIPKASKRALARAAAATAAAPQHGRKFIDLPVSVPAGTTAVASSTDLQTWQSDVTISFRRPLTLLIRDYNYEDTQNRFYRLVSTLP